MDTTEYKDLYKNLLARFASIAQVDDFIRRNFGVPPDEIYSPRFNLPDSLGK